MLSNEEGKNKILVLMHGMTSFLVCCCCSCCCCSCCCCSCCCCSCCCCCCFEKYDVLLSFQRAVIMPGAAVQIRWKSMQKQVNPQKKTTPLIESYLQYFFTLQSYFPCQFVGLKCICIAALYEVAFLFQQSFQECCCC